MLDLDLLIRNIRNQNHGCGHHPNPYHDYNHHQNKMLNINSPRRRADSLLCRSREEPSTDKICVPMMMIALVLILSFFHPSLSPLFPTSLVSVVNAQKCVSYSFKCCRNVHYSVMDILAETWDRQTCQMIDYELKTKLANYSKACQQAYADSFCLSTIAQCCSAQQPVSI